MSDIFNTFGVAWGPFLAQFIIILIVYAILSKYAFGPVLAIVEDRRKRIAEGEKNLKDIADQLATAEEKVQSMLDKANSDSERLIGEAKESASVVREQKTQEAITEAQGIIEKAHAASKLEHEKTMAELKSDFGRLVIDATSKVSGKVLDEADQKRINKETAEQVAL